MRIAYVSDPELVNSNYRAYAPMHALRDQGHDVEYNRIGEPLLPLERALGSDVIHVHRYIEDDVLSVLLRARHAGAGIVWDNDDDVTAVPRSNPNYATLAKRRRSTLMGVTRIVRFADVVTTPSEILAEQFRGLGAADVRVLENHLPDKAPQGAGRSRDNQVTIVWLAGLEHQVDYEQLRLRATFLRLLDEHRDLRVMSIGLGLGLQHDRYEHVRMVEFPDLTRQLARADVGIAPLVDIPWNAARSNVKVKEYAAAGLPWLASPLPPYRTLGEAQGGRLVEDDGWYDALDQLVRQARERRKLAKRAARWAKSQVIGKHASLWEDVYRTAIQRAGAAQVGAAPAALRR